MIEFRTKLPKVEFPFHISHQHSLLCMGSCFAENIARELEAFQFNCLANPFGILYNPISVSNGLELLMGSSQFSANDLFLHQGLWHSFQHHGRFSGPDRETVLNQLNKQLLSGQSHIQKTNRLLLTLGTAYTFRLKDSKQVVANCHKRPADEFDRELLSVELSVLALSEILKKLKFQHPEIEVVLTVSPIRHLRDGLIQNQRSKATLLLTAAALEQQFPFVHYYPAYEMVIDDLRDYRFYEKDMAHPNQLAVDYIWNHFQSTFFEANTQQIVKEVAKVIQAAQHRPFHPHIKEHQDFVHKQLARIAALKKQYSFLDLSKEVAAFEAQLV